MLSHSPIDRLQKEGGVNGAESQPMALEEIPFLGPPLSEGPLPAVFYFALSAEESLEIDPFNQPALFLTQFPMRIFSMTLPGHGKDLPATEAMTLWAKDISEGKNFVHHFVDRVEIALEELTKASALIKGKLGAMGLSRGGFIAAHAAARLPQFQTVLGFAPLTKLSYAKEFHGLSHPLTSSLDLIHIVSALSNCTLRFYIGNRDQRVGTHHSFEFISALTEASYHNKHRSPPVELILKPSIGHQGHGTAKETFEEGALWLKEQLQHG